MRQTAGASARAAELQRQERPFEVASSFAPAGDQPQAIQRLAEGLDSGLRTQVLLGVTGSGKTYTLAKAIERCQRPAIVLAPNRTLAAQLYSEFKEFFPRNAVEYFVSYYDYYQPEAYVPASDTYIEKDATVNEHIEQMRLSATKALLERRDVIVVCSVSAIYGLGDPESYLAMMLHLSEGTLTDTRTILRHLASLQYSRNDLDFRRGVYRSRGDTIDIFPADSEREALRVELFDEEVDRLSWFDPLTGEVLRRVPRATVHPKTHYVTPRDKLEVALESIRQELAQRLDWMAAHNQLLEAQRLEQRTRYDLEMLDELGFCTGIENYSRHFSGAEEGEPPATLFSYAAADTLVIADECHVSLPQLRAMYRGDRARKQTLVDFGFRLPSALDNRPLQYEEWERVRLSARLCLGHARRRRGGGRRPGGAAGGAAHRAGGPARGGAGLRAPGGRPDGRVPGRHQAGAARAGHHPDQAHGRRPQRLPGRARGARALPAQRHRHRRAGGDPARSAAGHL